MTFDRPILLLGLLSLVVLWLLSRAAWQRREVTVSSLFIWRRLGIAEDVPRQTRRRWDRLLLLRLLIALLLVLGAAGLRAGKQAARAELPVVVDDSRSMAAFQDGATRALDRVKASLPEGVTPVVSRSPDLSGLVAALARSPGGDVVYITDHPLDADLSRVRVLLVGEPVENVGFASAWLTEGDEGLRFHGVVRNYGRTSRTVDVVCKDGRETLALAAGEAGRVTLTGADPAIVTIEPGDRFAFDDEVVVRRDEGRRIPLRWIGPASPRLSLALRLAGIDIDESAEGAVAYRTAPVEGTRILVAPPGGAKRPAGPVTGVGEGISPESVPGRDISLGPASVLEPGGRTLLSDGSGPLAVLREGRLEVGIDPGDPQSSWTTDPSFPIFWADAAALLGCRSPGSVTVTALSEAESGTRPEGAAGDLSELSFSRPGAGRQGNSVSSILYLVAAALLVLHVVADSPRERSDPVDSPRHSHGGP